MAPKVPKADIEWPTIGLAAVIYGGWLALTWLHAALPWPVLFILGGWLTAWHGSLQHETIHGHPTRWRRLNRLIGLPPLNLAIPYACYRRTHLVHHVDERLTDPLEDPESYYWTPQAWAALPAPLRRVVSWQTTLAGRLIFGPPWVLARYFAAEWRLALAGDGFRRRLWLAHLAHVAALLAWIVGICGMNPLTYLLCFTYPGLSLVLLRSFAEHRAHDRVLERIAIVENAPVFGLLYLHNNLHAVHHEDPTVPWHRIPAYYRAHRERLIAGNGGLVYDGYGDVARRFLLTPHDHPVHPAGRAARAA